MTTLVEIKTVHSGVVGAPYWSTLYFEYISGSQAQAQAVLVRKYWDDTKTIRVTSCLSDVQPTANLIDDTTGAVVGTVSFTGLTTVAGTNSNANYDPASQGLSRFLTGSYISGRQLRGRLFHPAISVANIAAGGLQGSTFTALQTAADGLKSSGYLRVYSRTHGTSVAVTTTSVWTRLAVLRSRRD